MNEDFESLTDLELNAVVAVEVAGWVHETRARYAGKKTVQGFGRNLHLPLGSAERDFIPRPLPGLLPQFSTSADAVLTLLADHSVCITRFDGKAFWNAVITDGEDDTKWRSAKATTFARAACIALVRNARAKKGSA